jgi:hypothetical protein
MRGAITGGYFVQPVFNCDDPARGAYRHVAIHQRVIGGRLLGLTELSQQHRVQATHPGLVDRARMVGDQAREAVGHLLGAQPAGSVQGVEPGHHQLGRIPHVMQERRRVEQVTVFLRHRQGRPAGLLTDLAHMNPAGTQRCQQTTGL